MALNFGASSLVLGESTFSESTTGQAAVTRQLREDGGHAGAVHLLVDLVAEVLVGACSGKCGRRHATAASEVMPARARPVPFWRHGFLVECLTVCAVLLGARALARVGLEGHDHLVHQRFVVVAARTRCPVRRLSSVAWPLFVQELELHHWLPSWRA